MMLRVDSLFEIHKGHQLALNRVVRVREGGDAVAYVSRSHRNNGIAAWVRRIDGLPPANAGDISVCLRSRNHSLAAFVLTPKAPMTIQEKLWWCLCIRANRFRFHFGRQANRTIGSLLLPESIPMWVERAVVPTHANSDNVGAIVPIDTSSWQIFRILEIFSMHTGQHASRRSLGSGQTPLISASAWNNGITAMVAVPPEWKGGQITIANNGSIGAAFYQPRPFTASRDVTILEPLTPLSAAAALFICTVLRRESARFNYARKWTAGRMRESFIKLPTYAGQPDFGVMENFMRGLPLGWAVA